MRDVLRCLVGAGGSLASRAQQETTKCRSNTMLARNVLVCSGWTVRIGSFDGIEPRHVGQCVCHLVVNL
jgi:hypothetical protein